MTNPVQVGVYGAGGGATVIPGIITADRAPTVGDINFPLYQRWIDKSQGNREYILMGFLSNDPNYPKMVVPNWAILSYASFTTESLVTDDGVVVGVNNLAQIFLKGDSAQGLSTVGNAGLNTATIKAAPITLISGTGISITTSPVYLGQSTTISLAGTVLSLTWEDKTTNFTAQVAYGYFVAGNASIQLPTAPTNGQVVAFIVDGAFTAQIFPEGTHRIKIGSATSGLGASVQNTANGDTVWFVFRASTLTWLAITYVGNWTVNP